MGQLPEEVRRRLPGLGSTPARVLIGRAGLSYRTATHLELRFDHAAARDAVRDETDFVRDFGPAAIARFGLFPVASEAATKEEFLGCPDAGRRLSTAAREEIASLCPRAAELQVVLGDGLSAAALRVQGLPLLERLAEGAALRPWRLGRTFFVRHCRVGVINDVGAVLAPEIVVLLIGERPGLATAESLSAYMAFRPRPGHTDADRNLVSNIHARGVDHDTASRRILSLAEAMRRAERSGVAVKEDLSAYSSPEAQALRRRPESIG